LKHPTQLIRQTKPIGTKNDWFPTSWQSKPAAQQPTYRDKAALDEALKSLSRLPPLVTSWEVKNLKKQLAEATLGKSFLLQGGDCSESFEDCEASSIAKKLKILLQMCLVLIHGSKKRVIRIGRFAGQYVKPRSADMETRNGVILPSYRGDMINRFSFEEGHRVPNPEWLLRGYERAALTLNFIRSLVDGGFADMHHTEYWDLRFVSHSPQEREYRRIVESIGESISFMETITDAPIGEINRMDFYCSHEGLHLLYEQAQTRRVPHSPGWYNLSTHFPWIGNRTCDINGAHVEYFRGIENPIGVKVGPTMTPDELIALTEILNPNNEPGRLTLIHRFGADKISVHLPPLILAIQKARRIVLWCCDPMHGNTEVTSAGIKTRNFENILSELEQAFEIHHEQCSYLGGVHFELTGENVTECIGGARGLVEEDLSKAYKTTVDPRLNYEQSLEMALLIASKMAKMKEWQQRK
jgi:3-deoxy-7-phosphoheptulonate synthase